MKMNKKEYKYLNEAVNIALSLYSERVIKIIYGVIVPVILQTEDGEILILRRRNGNKVRYSIHNISNI